MKPKPPKQAARPRAAAADRKPRDRALAKGAVERLKSAQRKAASPAPLERRSQPPAKAARAAASRPPYAEDILREVGSLRAAIASPGGRGDGADRELESTVDSMRRLLSEMLEREREAVLGDLVRVRAALGESASEEAGAARSALESLMDRLGAVTFTAQRLDYVDPAIHEVKAERRVAGVPDGVVVEAVRSGVRSARGVVLAKAWVAVNRSVRDESTGH